MWPKSSLGKIDEGKQIIEFGRTFEIENPKHCSKILRYDKSTNLNIDIDKHE